MRAALIILAALGLTIGICLFIEGDFLPGFDDCPDNDCGTLLDLDDDDIASFDEEDEGA